MSMRDRERKLTAEALRLWLPIVLSLCAISLTVFQAATARRHARLSVQPRLDWRLTEEAAPGTLDLVLVNVGFGPGSVHDLAFVIDGKPIPAVDLDACHAVARLVGRDDPDRWDISCFASHRETVLRAGDTLTLFSSRPTAAHAAEDHTAELVDYNRLAASARYCSFYGDCWELKPE